MNGLLPRPTATLRAPELMESISNGRARLGTALRDTSTVAPDPIEPLGAVKSLSKIFSSVIMVVFS